jgi:hypothetical protein
MFAAIHSSASNYDTMISKGTCFVEFVSEDCVEIIKAFLEKLNELFFVWRDLIRFVN